MGRSSKTRSTRVEALDVEGLPAPVEVRRHPTARRMTLRVSRTRHAVILTVPLQCNLADAGNFLHTHLDWVRGHLRVVFFGLMSWWSIVTIIAFTVAGERMPWLTYHMAWPMVLMTGWAVGQIIESIAARMAEYKPQQMILAILVLAVFAITAFQSIRTFYGSMPPFQGTELTQLQATSAFLFPLIAMILSGVLLAYLMKDDLASLGTIGLFILALIAFGSSVINGATLMMASSTTGIDPASLTPDRIKFLLTLVLLVGSIVGLVVIARIQRASIFHYRERSRRHGEQCSQPNR